MCIRDRLGGLVRRRGVRVGLGTLGFGGGRLGQGRGGAGLGGDLDRRDHLHGDRLDVRLGVARFGDDRLGRALRRFGPRRVVVLGAIGAVAHRLASCRAVPGSSERSEPDPIGSPPGAHSARTSKAEASGSARDSSGVAIFTW